jgi:mono/diheme cytochrome c family protein
MIEFRWIWATVGMCMLVGAAVAGCESDDNGGDAGNSGGQGNTIDCDSGAVPTFASLDFSTCTGCHSSERSGAARTGAPSDINFDVYATAKTHASHAVEEIEEGEMPPPSRPKPSQAVVDAIAKWAACGTPE